MTTLAHIHKWVPVTVMHRPGRYCDTCGWYEVITRSLFKRLFKFSWSAKRDGGINQEEEKVA